MSKRAIVFKIKQSTASDEYFIGTAYGIMYFDDETEESVSISYGNRHYDLSRSSRVRKRYPVQEALSERYGGVWEWSSPDTLEATY